MASPNLPQQMINEVERDVLFLAILEGELRRAQAGIEATRQRIEAKVPGASRLAQDADFVAAALEQHNAQAVRG